MKKAIDMKQRHRRSETLPIRETLKKAIRTPWLERHRLFYILLLPASANFLIAMLSPDDSGVLNLLPYALMTGLVLVLMAVACHRLFLLDIRTLGRWKLMRWSRRETLFFGWGVVIYLVYIILCALLVSLLTFFVNLLPSDNFLEEPAWFFIGIFYLGFVPGLYVFARLSLVLPATALDKHQNIKWAWAISEGNGWRLTLVTGIFPLMLYTVMSFLPAQQNGVVVDIFYELVTVVVMVLEVSVLSFSYQKLIAINTKSSSIPVLPDRKD